MKQLVRNFSIIAHIDHGKTTLTDRLLLLTGTISQREFKERVLDSNPIEQERGITIKMAPVRMEYRLPERMKSELGADELVMNLIDTPGHVDFSYEVSRSLAAVEGAILLVDATQGVQAQTLSHYEKTKEHQLAIIPVLNKVDLPNADVDRVRLEMMEMFDVHEDEFVLVSAKTGLGVEVLLEAIANRIPVPKGKVDEPLRALVFNSFYHAHKGVVAAVRIMDGVLSPTSNLATLNTKALFQAPEVGRFIPTMKEADRLVAGEVGYIATGLKDIRMIQVGDTITLRDSMTLVIPLPGYTQPQLMVYMDFYPIDGDAFQVLKDAMEKLQLNDSALQFSATHSLALGNGLRVGFLGILHAEIVQERLEREFDLGLIATSPSVRYELELTSGEKLVVTNPGEFPDPSMIAAIYEPVVKMVVYTPKEYVGAVMQLCEDHRGEMENMHFIGDRTQLVYRIPLPEIIVTFFDELKSVSSGYASVEYELTGYAAVDAVKLSVLINHEPVEALSQIVVREKAEQVGRQLAAKLKEVIPRQLFEIPIQAAIGGKVVARETIKAFRKDVTAKLYGGDRTRRMKLLEKQKKGKERRKLFGKVEIPQSAFMAVLKRD